MIWKRVTLIDLRVGSTETRKVYALPSGARSDAGKSGKKSYTGCAIDEDRQRRERSKITKAVTVLNSAARIPRELISFSRG